MNGQKQKAENLAILGFLLSGADGTRTQKESSDPAELGSIRDGASEATLPKNDVKSPTVDEPVTRGDSSTAEILAALATALERASAAGQWELVGLLAAELAARR